jgi:hypothetical protein
MALLFFWFFSFCFGEEGEIKEAARFLIDFCVYFVLDRISYFELY